MGESKGEGGGAKMVTESWIVRAMAHGGVGAAVAQSDGLLRAVAAAWLC
jgi:hypothetical protein